MTEKTELINNIKSWIGLDNEIKILQKEIKNRREQKKLLTNELVGVMKNNDIDKLVKSLNGLKPNFIFSHLGASEDTLEKSFTENIQKLLKNEDLRKKYSNQSLNVLFFLQLLQDFQLQYNNLEYHELLHYVVKLLNSHLLLPLP